jgi:hypothetical protein
MQLHNIPTRWTLLLVFPLFLALLIAVAIPFADDIYAAAVTKTVNCPVGKGVSMAASNLKGQWVLSAHSNLRPDGTRLIRAATGQCSTSTACSRSKGFAALGSGLRWAFVKASASHSTPTITAARCT